MRKLRAWLLFTLVLIASLSAGPRLRGAPATAGGLNIEIQVVPQVSLRISTPGQKAISGAPLLLEFGRVDAFGISRSAGVYVENLPQGAAYYFPVQIEVGSSGSSLRGALRAQLAPGGNTTQPQIFEGEGERMMPGQALHVLRGGETALVSPAIAGAQIFPRIVGVVVRPETPAGPFSGELQYSLEMGAGI